MLVGGGGYNILRTVIAKPRVDLVSTRLQTMLVGGGGYNILRTVIAKPRVDLVSTTLQTMLVGGGGLQHLAYCNCQT